MSLDFIVFFCVFGTSDMYQLFRRAQHKNGQTDPKLAHCPLVVSNLMLLS